MFLQLTIQLGVQFYEKLCFYKLYAENTALIVQI